MHRSVRDMRDLCLLFTVEEEGAKEMGYPSKKRADLLNKTIQFIWDYQQKHNGDTPALNVVEKHVGISNSAGGYYIAILVDEGRLDRIGTRPFRVTINENNKENQRAIASWKRIQERIERTDEAERNRVREEQAQLRETEQRESDHGAALALVSDRPAVSDIVVAEHRPKAEVDPIFAPSDTRMPIARNWDRQMHPEQQTPVERFDEAQTRVREVNKEVKAMMPRLLKIADERDLVFELVSRGYRVDKVR